MYRARLLTSLACAAACIALSAAPGYAKQTDVVTDCNAHGQLTHTYTLTQLRGALATMPPAIKEYTNCFDVVQRQLLAQLGTSPTKPPSNSGDSGSGGSFLPLPVIIVLVVLVGAAGAYAVMAVRRRGSGGPPGSA